MRGPQPLGCGHAPGPAAGAVPRHDPRAVARGGLRLRRGDQGGGVRAANSKRHLKVVPVPPNFKNHGNEVVSVSALARYQQRLAEEAGAYILTETSATQLIVEDGRVVGVRSGDKGRGKEGEELGNFEPGSDIKAQATVLAEGCWGHLTGAAIREFDLAKNREPQVWELGVKEVWKVPKALDRVIHTLGPWPLHLSSQVRTDRRHLAVPDEEREDRRGSRLDRVRRRPRLPRRHDVRARPAAAVQAAPARQGNPRGRRARRLGREGASRRRLLVGAEADDARRRARGRQRGPGRRRRAQGRAPLHQLRQARRRGDLRRAQARRELVRRLRGRARGVRHRQGALPGAQRAPADAEGTHRRRPARPAPRS